MQIMEKVNIIPFEWYHVPTMNLRTQEREYFEMIPGHMDRIKAQKNWGPSFSAVAEGRGIICSWGFSMLWPGVFDLWLITSKLVEERRVQMIRQSRAAILDAAIAMKAHRFQITINPRFLHTVRFAEALYFEKEGVLKSYGPDGSDYLMYARIFNVPPVQQTGHVAPRATSAASDGFAAEAAGPARLSAA